MKTFKANSLMWYCRYATPTQVKVLRNITVKDGETVQIECEVSHDIIQATVMPLASNLYGSLKELLNAMKERAKYYTAL